MQDLVNSVPEHTLALSPQQIVWLEAYKATMCRSYYTNSDSCAAAENAVKAFNKVFKGGDTL